MMNEPAGHAERTVRAISPEPMSPSRRESLHRQFFRLSLGQDRWCMIIREFPVDAAGTYIDHPHGLPRRDQAFQAWDGLGFGEVEFHSCALDAETGPRDLRESDRLWIFGGASAAIMNLGRHLLHVNVGDLCLRRP